VRQTASGRWMPAKLQQPERQKSSPDGDDTELASLQAYVREAIAAGVVMPWWYPLMSFEAAIGREALRR
jgi:hypothetical protein